MQKRKEENQMEKRNKILKIGLTIITILIVAIIGIVIYDRVTVNNKYRINKKTLNNKIKNLNFLIFSFF